MTRDKLIGGVARWGGVGPMAFWWIVCLVVAWRDPSVLFVAYFAAVLGSLFWLVLIQVVLAGLEILTDSD
jgi:hypothetical protein